jgi:hypothetical protein
VTFQVSAGAKLKICSEDQINDMMQYVGLKIKTLWQLFWYFCCPPVAEIRYIMCVAL